MTKKKRINIIEDYMENGAAVFPEVDKVLNKVIKNYYYSNDTTEIEMIYKKHREIFYLMTAKQADEYTTKLFKTLTGFEI